jgi:hypothetical protein
MCGAILPFPKYTFMAWCSVAKKKKGHRDNFTFTFIFKHPQSMLFLYRMDLQISIIAFTSLGV